MPALRNRLHQLGFHDVVTVLQSGNIILTSNDDAEAVRNVVEKALAEDFGAAVPCLVRTAAEVFELLGADPLDKAAEDGTKYLVTFLSSRLGEEALARLAAIDEAHSVVGSEAYVWAPYGVKKLKLSEMFLESEFGVVATARNMNTLHRIAAKL
jgi:uncharacterized protein (DUF1697 family)